MPNITTTTKLLNEVSKKHSLIIVVEDAQIVLKGGWPTLL